MKSLVILILILAVATVVTAVFNLMTPRLGVVKGRLAPCPALPNCVSSQATDPTNHIEPLPYHPEGIKVIAEIIEDMPRSEIIAQDEAYLHAVFSSPTFRFKDDVEFYRNDESGVIDVRSAARIGYYDFDVNRKRAEAIRSVYLKRPRLSREPFS